MVDIISKEIKLNLLNDDKFEIGSIDDADLMRVICFGTHEGVNLNKTEFPREVLLNSYKSFIDKPLVLLPNLFGEPTGHGFNFKTHSFDTKNRKFIGHIVDAKPCIVSGDSINIAEDDDDDIDFLEKDGELRIICTAIVYKWYMAEFAETLERLHSEGNLKFSMEGVVDYEVSEDGIKHCTNINFTGLAVVQNPAFENSYSLEVAEDDNEGGKMDYEKAYNELKAKYDEVLKKYNELKGGKKPQGDTKPTDKSGGGSGGSGGGSGKSGCAEVDIDKYTEMAEKVATLTVKIAELEPYKEKVETAERQAIGEKRHACLEKMGYTEKSATELAECTQEEYAELLETAINAQNTKSEADVSESKNDSEIGINFHNASSKTGIDMFNEILNELCK